MCKYTDITSLPVSFSTDKVKELRITIGWWFSLSTRTKVKFYLNQNYDSNSWNYDSNTFYNSLTVKVLSYKKYNLARHSSFSLTILMQNLRPIKSDMHLRP